MRAFTWTPIVGAVGFLSGGSCTSGSNTAAISGLHGPFIGTTVITGTPSLHSPLLPTSSFTATLARIRGGWLGVDLVREIAKAYLDSDSATRGAPSNAEAGPGATSTG
ncbi:unnamed protein product, partial [Choristocarpus tenellus]